MIYTITLNPALDRTIWIDRIRDDVSNRILDEKSFAGGKSIDVSKVLKNLVAWKLKTSASPKPPIMRPR